MNKEKRMAYCTNNTQVGFHTGNGTTDNMIDFEVADNINIINSCNVRKVRNRDWYKTYIRVNPNKNNGGYILEKYSDFKKVMKTVFDEIGVDDFEWKRIDLSFNTLDNEYYENYTKLNRLLIACFASATNDYNTYDTRNFWTGCTKSLATKNNYREVEFYDKQDESQNRSPYYSRLEFRSLRMRADVETEFLTIWFDRLDKAVKEFENVQHKFNQNMAEIYLNDLKKKKRERQFLGINSFLMTRKDYIFTSRQMKNLLMLIGLNEKQAQNKAYNFKKYHKIEYFKKEDLVAIVADIKTKITDYFSK
ncbi:MAG: hypothetical protein E7403_00920 [Ruminococcaceae bacterium]|nr:hypothetical protein [Oscillospiraceae bacterium]